MVGPRGFRANPRGERRICKPMLKFSPRLDAVAQAVRQHSPRSIADLSAEDLDEDRPVSATVRPGAARRPHAAAPVAAMPAPTYAPPRPAGTAATPPISSRPLAPPPAPRPAAAAPRSATAFPEPYRAPLYNRPPVAGQQPQFLSGQGIY